MFKELDHWWPDGIKPTAPAHAIKRRDEAFRAMAPHFPHADERRVVVTAGGMTGLWSLEYLKHGFRHVVTFEPAPHVWPCLVENTKHKGASIEAYNEALGAFPTDTGVVINSVGSSYIDPASSERVSIVRLDSFMLERCDWLQFDLEGYEYPALVGASETIRRHSPPIQLEMRGLADKRGYGFGDADVLRFLDERGYVEAARIPGSDVIYKRVR